VIYVRDGVEFAGQGGKLRSELFGLEKLLFFTGVEDAESGMTVFAEHATGAAIGELTETLVVVRIGAI
jgi:hypothetical protein